MASETACMHGSSEGWRSSSQRVHASMTDYLGFSVADTQPSDSQFNLKTVLEYHGSTNHNLHKAAAPRGFFAERDTQHSP